MCPLNDMEKNIVIVYYNTKRLTECLVKSINKFVKDAKIYIFDNSDKQPFTQRLDNVTVLDNTKGELVDFEAVLESYPDRTRSSAKRNNYASAKHCMSVDKCMELIDGGFILLDSDVLLKKDISPLFDENYAFIGGTKAWSASKPMNPGVKKRFRAIPFLCYINCDMCKENGVRYFSGDHMYGLTENGDSYDTGTYFLESVSAAGLKWKKINIDNYIVHYMAGSWVKEAKKYDNYATIGAEKWIERNKRFWDTEKKKVVKQTKEEQPKKKQSKPAAKRKARSLMGFNLYQW